MTWNQPAADPTEAAMREFITREIGRLLRTDEFAHDFVAEAERMIAGIRGMLPARDSADAADTAGADTAGADTAGAAAGPAADDLSGTLVIARVAAPDGPREIIGILRSGAGGHRVYDIPVDAAAIRPLTREDAEVMLRVLEESDLSWPGPAAEGPS